MGTVFLAYADEFGVLQFDQVLIQTDGWSKFEGTQVIKQPHGFTHTIESFGATH